MPGLESGLATTLLAGPALAANLYGAPAALPEAAEPPQAMPLTGGLEIPMPYAPAYCDDPAAHHLPFGARQALRGFTQTVTDIERRNGQQVTFVVRGYASPDKGFTGDAGLRETMPEDQQLATQRGKVVATALGPMLRKQGADASVELLPGKDTTLSEAQTAEITNWAHALNYKDAGALVQDWRQGDLRDRQPILATTLDHLVGSWAMVRVTAVPGGKTASPFLPLPSQQPPAGA